MFLKIFKHKSLKMRAFFGQSILIQNTNQFKSVDSIFCYKTLQINQFFI